MARGEKKKGPGWFNESENHAKAAKGEKVRPHEQAKLDVGKGQQTKLTGERTAVVTPEALEDDDEEESEDHETIKETAQQRVLAGEQDTLDPDDTEADKINRVLESELEAQETLARNTEESFRDTKKNEKKKRYHEQKAELIRRLMDEELEGPREAVERAEELEEDLENPYYMKPLRQGILSDYLEA